jgi:hypothetical protein
VNKNIPLSDEISSGYLLQTRNAGEKLTDTVSSLSKKITEYGGKHHWTRIPEKGC